MKLFFVLILFITLLNSTDYSGNIEYFYKNLKNIKDENSINFKLKLQNDQDNYTLYSQIETLNSNKNNYTKLNEAYIKYFINNDEILIGKEIKFFGVLEGYNITDIFNKKNILYDPFDKKRKLGRYNLSYTKEFEEYDGDISFIIASTLQNNNISLDKYDKFIKYSLSTDESDINFLLYDSLNITKYLTYNNFIYNNIIFKLEYSYSKNILKDYYESGFGIEKEFNNITIYTEYYKSNNKLLQMQNDIFIALKYDFKNIDDTNIKFGIFKDLDNYIYTKSFEYETRYKENFKIKLQYINYNKISQNYYIKIGYYF